MKFLLSTVVLFSLVIFTSIETRGDSTESAEVDYYLIIGSFRNKDRADKALAMFAKRSVDKLAIQKAEAFGETWHRVAHGPYDVINNSLKTEFVAIGVHDAWWLQIERLVAAVEITPAPAAVVVDEPSITPPRADESYIHYCVSKANAAERNIYCSDSDFSALGEIEKSSATLAQVQQGLGDSPKELQALAGFCLLKANASQRATYCSQ
jgi:hypothetical protein